MDITIRTYASGDDIARVGIFNEAAAALPKFKPASLDEIRRRTHAADFDPSAQFFAIVNDRPVGYAAFQANGRVGFPWCRQGHEHLAEPLLDHVLREMQARGHRRAFAAYRADWPSLTAFFTTHGFQQTHEMVNFILELADMPTPAARTTHGITPLTREDLPALLELCPEALAITDLAALERWFLHNPYFPSEAVFVMRGKSEDQLAAVGTLITNSTYADPTQVDSLMPCFRLGAFGTEGMTTKRINGMFSFLTPDNREVSPIGLDLLGYVAQQLFDTDLSIVAAQVSSKVPHLLRFYSRYFRKQGGFPVFERAL